jgi:hypothetical protein
MSAKGTTVAAATLAAMVLCASNAAFAEIYKWVDQNGVVNYSSSPPPNGRTTRVITEEKVSTIEAAPLSAAEVEALNERIAGRRRAGDATAVAPTGGSGGVGSIPTVEPIVEQRVYYPGYVNQPPRWRNRDRKHDNVIGPGPYGVGGQAAPAPRRYGSSGREVMEER